MLPPVDIRLGYFDATSDFPVQVDEIVEEINFLFAFLNLNNHNNNIFFKT